jgi:hypothetical protein
MADLNYMGQTSARILNPLRSAAGLLQISTKDRVAGAVGSDLASNPTEKILRYAVFQTVELSA